MIVLTAAQIAGVVVTGLVGFAGLVGMLWKLTAAVVRHVDATRANTSALATLGTTLTTHITRSDARASAHERRIRHLERLNNVST